MKRDISIDIIKFIAALLITNSHMERFYPEVLNFMGTGGAIGDALFFFCSGFTLFLKPMDRFDNWYKKRINRIFPSAYCWVLLSVIFLKSDISITGALEWSGGWFVHCIMIYYVIIFIINKTAIKHLHIVFTFTIIFITICYIIWDNTYKTSIYGASYFSWILYFIYMLFGAIMGVGKISIISPKKSIIILGISLISFYTILISSQRIDIINDIQIISTIPLLGIVYSTYSLFNSDKSKKIFKNKIINWIVMFIGGLCLEIYIVQGNLLQMINFDIIFPLNYIIAFIIIILSAYVLRCTTRLLKQTFSNNPYSWNNIFKTI